MPNHCYPVNLNNVIIPECLYRESSDFTTFKVAGSPTKAFGDDNFVALIFFVSSGQLHANRSVIYAITEFKHKLTEQQ